MDNYYKILEVDKEASSETIDKVYKMLVKKYHPDLQEDEEKSKAEEMIKKVNEAYDVLSDSVKRENFDKQLANTEVSYEEYASVVNENMKLKDELNFIREKLNNVSHLYNNIQNNNINNNYNNNNSYNNNQAYQAKSFTYQTQEKPNYNIFNKKTYKKKSSILKRILKICFSLCLTAFIIFLLLQVPFLKNIFYTSINSDKILLIILIILLIYLSSKR